MRKVLTFTLCITLLIVTSCVEASSLPEYEDLSESTNFTVLNFRVAKFDYILWRMDGLLLAIQDEDVRPLQQPYAFEGDTQLRYFDLKQDDNCELTQYRFPTLLPDGRLGWIKWCVTDNAFTDTSYIVAYDWKTGQLEQIVQNPLKHVVISECFSWNPEMTKGIQAVRDGLTGTLNWVTRVGPEPVHITLRNGNRAWNLAKDFEENGSREGGRISCPAWSPKENGIAVFASLDAMGVTGIARLDKPSQLFLLSTETGEAESVLSGIYLPQATEWSPDGEKVAFTGALANKVEGVWIFEIKTRLLTRIAREGYFKDLSWSPDSQRIAVIWCDAIDCDTSEVREYKLLE